MQGIQELRIDTLSKQTVIVVIYLRKMLTQTLLNKTLAKAFTQQQNEQINQNSMGIILNSNVDTRLE